MNEEPEIRNLDLSAKTFDEFVESFFARGLDDEEFQHSFTALEGQHYDEAIRSPPMEIVKYLTNSLLTSAQLRLLTLYSKLTKQYGACWDLFINYRNSTFYLRL
jgi:hypothetical protein